MYFPRAGTVDQAFAQLADAGRGAGMNMRQVNANRTKLASGHDAVILLGVTDAPDGSRIVWEGIFVPTRDGVRAITVGSSKERFEDILPLRQAVFRSVQVK
jgi:hypothetical protein